MSKLDCVEHRFHLSKSAQLEQFLCTTKKIIPILNFLSQNLFTWKIEFIESFKEKFRHRLWFSTPQFHSEEFLDSYPEAFRHKLYLCVQTPFEKPNCRHHDHLAIVGGQQKEKIIRSNLNNYNFNIVKRKETNKSNELKALLESIIAFRVTEKNKYFITCFRP